MAIETAALVPFALSLLFYVLLFIFTVYAFFLAYHWFTYGAHKQTALIALATFLIGGAILLLTLALAINLT